MGEDDERLRDLVSALLARNGRIEELIQEVHDLHGAADRRAVIEQAKGVIMSAMHCNADAAFAVLVAQSQTENRKLRDIAAEIAAVQDRRSE